MSNQVLPSHASVVVIGGGIMGCSTLYHLAEMGVGDAVLLERNKLTSGTTWHSAAQVRALRSSHNLTRMIQYSVDLYARLEAETGQNVGWIQKGSLSIATTPDRLTHVRRQESLAMAYGVEASFVNAGEAAERWPLMRSDDVLGAVFSKTARCAVSKPPPGSSPAIPWRSVRDCGRARWRRWQGRMRHCWPASISIC